MKSQYKKYLKYLLILFAFIGYVVWKISEQQNRVKYVSETGILTLGCIVEVQTRRARSDINYIYVYKVGDKVYRRGTYVNYAYSDIKYEIGDEIWVMYDKDNFDSSYELDYLEEKELVLDTARIYKQMELFDSTSYCR